MTIKEKIAGKLIIDFTRTYGDIIDMQSMLACLHALGLSMKNIESVINFIIDKDDYKIIEQIMQEYNCDEKKYMDKLKLN